MGILESVLAGLIVAAISWGAGYGFKQLRVRGAPKRYVERLGEMIEKAYKEGPEHCEIHARAIVATRNTLRSSLQRTSEKLNSEIDRLAEQLRQPFQQSKIVEKIPRPSEPKQKEVWQTIQMLKEYWPAKSIEIEYEIKKIIVELDL